MKSQTSAEFFVVRLILSVSLASFIKCKELLFGVVGQYLLRGQLPCTLNELVCVSGITLST